MGWRFKGIRKGYPEIRRRFGKIAAYIHLCRPFTLMAPLLAGIFGVLTPVKDVTLQNLYTAIYVGVTLALAQATGQVLNQYADTELDKIIKSYRPIPSGLVTREEALGLSWLLAIFAVGRAFTISTFFGLVSLTLLFFAVFYSLAPFSPRKIHPIINTGWMAVSRGFLPMFAVWSVYGNLTQAWQYSLLAFLWVMGFQATKDVPDSEGDKRFGIKTIPNTYRLKGLVACMIICSTIYSALAFYFRVYIMFLTLPLAIIAVLTTRKQSSLTENTYAWICFYGGLALLYILMFISELLV